MKNKHLGQKHSDNLIGRLLRSGVFIVAAIVLLVSVLVPPAAQALPGQKYRYKADVCGNNDIECFKYSAEAGSYRSYRSILNRQPESGGFLYWAQRLQSGASSLTDVSASLLASSEWQGQYGSINNQQFVTQMYRFALNRTPNTTDNNFWVNELNNGRSRANTAASFVTSSEAAGVQHAAFMNYFRPSSSPPPSSPPPAQPPATPPAQPPAPKPSTPSARAPAQSPASASGLQISDFKITELEYRSVLLNWKTNKPSSTKANYSTSKDDLYTEQKNDNRVTDHSLRLEGEGVRAGQHYFVRVTSDDGSGPVTIDGEFDTKPVSVIIKVTNESNQPAPDATVTVKDTTGVTDANGELTLNLPEGEITIFAEKEDLSQQILAKIEVPSDGTPQRISLSLSKVNITELTSQASAKKGFPWGTVLLVLLVLGAGGVGGFIFWRRRRSSGFTSSSYRDPLEAENYTQIPSTPVLPDPSPSETPFAPPPPPDIPLPESPVIPEPSYQQLHNLEIPHHASLPELVGRYGVAASPVDIAGEDEALTPTGQHVPHHTSLKDMVQIPYSEGNSDDLEPGVDDLPASPVQKEPSRPTETTKKTQSHSSSSEDDGSLTIEHS